MRAILLVSRIITCESENNLFYSQPNDQVCLEIDLSSGYILQIHPTLPKHLDPEVLVYEFPVGSTLMPGFIDCHVHLTGPPDNYQMNFLQTSSASSALWALKKAQGLLRAGFTTLRSAGDADLYYPTFAVAKSIQKGDFCGPRIVGAGHYITVTGGGGDINTLAPDNCPCSTADGLKADGKDQMLLAVRKEIKYGSDWIKILVTGAFMTASTNARDSPENTHFSSEELSICVEEARRRRTPVMAHAHGAEGIILAANAGVRSIEHASFIDEEGIRACLKNGTWIVPTFSVGKYFEINGSESGTQDRLIQLQDKSNARYYQCIQKAVQAGVKVALGSDYCGWDPALNTQEFVYMVNLAKMTPTQAIYAGTGSAADLLEITDIGRILPGKLADIVIVQGNPIEDINVLATGVRFVMKGGIVVRDDHSIVRRGKL